MILAALIPILGPLLDRLIPDPAERERAISEMAAQANAAALAQAKVNEVEASSASLFVAGWRPWIGWVCGMGLAWSFIGAPVATWAVAIWHPGTPLPNIPAEHLLELVFAMLGLGGLRTVEKIKGAAR